MPAIHLTFFCELDTPDLQELFAGDQLINDLKALNAAISLGIPDLSPERAGMVRRLNQAGIPMIAWLLLPKEQGYWLNVDNAPNAVSRYDEFRRWTVDQGLQWEAIGLDIEPDFNQLHGVMRSTWKLAPLFLRRSVNFRSLRRARSLYKQLVARIHSDGYRVDSYQLPFIVDDRKAHSAFIQRATGIVDIPTDREVLMLYTSFARPYGVGALWSYAPDTDSFGLGSAGGGVEIDPTLIDTKPLEWDELARDLRLAYAWGDDIHIFSLEGCVRQGFLEKLKTFEFDQPIFEPTEQTRQVEAWREGLRPLLWVGAHPVMILSGLAGILFTYAALRRKFKRK